MKIRCRFIFTRSLTCPLIFLLLAHSFRARRHSFSLYPLLTRSLSQLFTRSRTHILTRCLAFSLARSLPRLLSCSLTRAFSYPLAVSLLNSLILILAHSLSFPPSPSSTSLFNPLSPPRCKTIHGPKRAKSAGDEPASSPHRSQERPPSHSHFSSQGHLNSLYLYFLGPSALGCAYMNWHTSHPLTGSVGSIVSRPPGALLQNKARSSLSSRRNVQEWRRK